MSDHDATLDKDHGASPSEFFRCPVQADQGDAKVTIGRKRIRGIVQETSIDGFTVLIGPEYTSKLDVSKPWVLDYDKGRHEVHAQWFFHAPDGHVQVGLRRLRDLTKPGSVKSNWTGPRARSRVSSDSSSSTLAFAGFVIFLLTSMALPGLGDRLGTARPMGEFFKTIAGGVTSLIRNVL